MKKLLLFLVLFGSGLALLLFLSSRQRREKQERVPTSTEDVTPTQDLPFTRIPEGVDGPPTEDTSGDGQSGIGGTLSGQFEASVFEKGVRGHKVYDLAIVNVIPLGDDLYDLEGITAHTYDPDNESLESTLVAERGQARIEWREGRFAVGREETVKLFDAVVTLHQGVPMAPLELTLVTVQGDLERDVFTSEEAVLIEGVGVRGTSLGIRADQGTEELQLLRDGHVFLQVDEQREVELLATGLGPMTVRRTGIVGDVESLELVVSDGARAISKGAEELTIDSRELTVRGESRSSGEEEERERAFLPTEAIATGEVLAKHAGGEFSGGRAVALFDELGQVERLTVSEEPVFGGEVIVETESGEGPEPLWLELSGEGPLVADYTRAEGVADFNMEGPATVQARDAELRLAADDRIDGQFFEDGRAEARLRGGVSGRLHGMDFVGRNVDLSGREDAEGQRRLIAVTDEPAHIEGEDKEGRPFELDTKGVLQVLVDRAQLLVPLAVEAHLEILDEALWTADVGRMADLDVAAGSFVASEGVLLTGPLGVTRAARGRGYSRTHIELFGAPATEEAEAQPVRFDLDERELPEIDSGFLRGMHVILREGSAHADQDVELRLKGPTGVQELDCEWAEVRYQGDPQTQAEVPFEFEAREVTRAMLRDEDGTTLGTARVVSGHGILRRDEAGEQTGELLELTGSGGVTVTYAGESVFTGTGERFTWSPEDGGHLEARAGERVEARGSFQPGGAPYLLTATWIEYVEGRFEALSPKIVQDLSVFADPLVLQEAGVELRSAVADWMAVDDVGLLLSGNAHFEGLTKEGSALELDAASMHLEHEPGADASAENFEHLVAWDGFVLRMGDDLVGRGEVLEAGYEVLRMEGRPARLEAGGFALEAHNIVYDVPRVLITTGQGRFVGAEGSEWEGWVATYESLQPFEFGDSTIMTMRHPILVKGVETVQADWALLWVDRDEWIVRTENWLGRAQGREADEPIPQVEQEEAEPEVETPTLFGRVNSGEISRVVKEIYLEGGVEYLVDGERVAKLGSAYVDMADGHGWFRDCELWIRTSVRGVPTRIAARAEWMRHSADGTLSADDAQVTDCEWAEPDYYIHTRNLRMKPAGDGASVWDVLLKDNSLEFNNGLSLPLPKVHYKSDGKGLPTLGAFQFGDSARFGTFVQATMNVEVGETVAAAAAPLMQVEPEEISGNWRLRASYYDLRGPLLGTGFQLRAADKFWMNLYVDGVFDTGRDVGIVRSKTSGGNEFRWVIHSRSRYLLSEKEWFDLQFATQSDPGVQPEFYEGSFIHYDKRDTFLRWRKADDAAYYSANARIRMDDFRNDVERLPDLGALRGLTPLTMVAGVPLLYTASVDAAYLRRREGDATVFSPFDPVFDDGLGNRDFLRADTRHRVEAPFSTGVGGVRLTPYSSLTATAWSEGQDTSTSPSRGALIAGAQAETVLYRTWGYGVIHDLTPLVGARADLGTFDADGQPVQIDRRDAPLEGKFFDFGLRSRWRVPGSNRKLDIAAKVSHGTDVAEGVEEGWQPVSVLGDFLAVARGIPFGIRHDARYDTDDGETTLSYTGFSILPWDTVGLEVAYHHALDDQRELLYDATTIGGRWEASPKWQIEGRQTISRIDNSNLDSTLLIRRIGHDFIFEVQYGFRAGEGSSSLGFNFRPELGWRRPGFGLIDNLKSLRL